MGSSRPVFSFFTPVLWRAFKPFRSFSATSAFAASITMQPILKKIDGKDKSLRALVLTSNPHKVAEYKNTLTSTYGVRIFTKPLPASLESTNTATQSGAKSVDDSQNASIRQILTETTPTPHFILCEKTGLYDAITHEPIDTHLAVNHHMRPVLNRSTLQVWRPLWNPQGELCSVSFQEYKHRVNGYIDTTRASQGKGKGFGWDAVFVNSATGETYAHDASHWGKNSARQLVIDDFITEYLFYSAPQDLENYPLSPKETIDFDISVAHFMMTNHYLSNPHLQDWGLDNVFENILNRGLFFKAAESRPLKNYFSPPFAGVPLTSKKSKPETTVFMVHDMNHHNVPDLIYDGIDTTAHKHVYAAWRMMSEAMTMIMADMLYADSIVKFGADPKDVDKRIYPLFQALDLPEITDENRLEIIIRLLKANIVYAVLGDDSLWKAMLKPGQEDKLETFKNHFSKFFIGDHNWTHANYTNMAKISGHYKTWAHMVGQEQFKRADVRLLSEAVKSMEKRGCDLTDFENVVHHTFNEIIETRILPAFKTPASLSEEERLSNAFYRYMIGQTSFYAKHDYLPGLKERGTALIKRLTETRHFDAITRKTLRDQFKQDVYHVWGKRMITTAMAANYCQLHPIFPPFYISYQRPEDESILAAQQKLYKRPLALMPSTPAATLAAKQEEKLSEPHPFVITLNGVTFIDDLALENAIDKNIPAEERLREKMIKAGVTFWDPEKTIIKKPVIAIKAIGGLSIKLDKDHPDKIRFYLGNTSTEPLTLKEITAGLSQTMGSQSFHTNMNPNKKSSEELYDITVKLAHFSVLHSATIGFVALGLSTKAELEFNSQRDIIYLARETSARSRAQGHPCLVALTARGLEPSKEVRKNTALTLTTFDKTGNTGNTQDWLEERNALFPKSSAVSLGISGTLRNLGKLVADLGSTGKELEYRNALTLMNDSLHGLFPELFKPSQDYGRPPYQKSSGSAAVIALLLAAAITAATTKKEKPKHAILLLGAPGVGKSTQTERLLKQLPGVMCVSTGNLVRKLNKKIEEKQPLNAVEQYAAESLDRMRQGQLMDDKAVYDLLMAYLAPGGEGYAEYQQSHTIILDGVIKASTSIKPFEIALQSFNTRPDTQSMSINQVINIAASSEDLILRQETRVAKAKAEGLPQRPDDDVAIYRKRLNDYTNHINGVIQHFKENNVYQDVDSSQGIERTTQLLVQAITEAHPLLSKTQGERNQYNFSHLRTRTSANGIFSPPANATNASNGANPAAPTQTQVSRSTPTARYN